MSPLDRRPPVEEMIPRQVLYWDQTDWHYKKFLDKGIIFLQDEIGDEISFEFAHELIYLTKIEPPMNGEIKKPIWVIIDSPGGDVFAGLAIYDVIKAAVAGGMTVNILGKGLMASMATVILQAGSKRFALPNTQFLVHEVGQVIPDIIEKVSEGEERVEESKRLNRIVMNIIAERVGTNTDELIKLSKKRDYWFDTQGALKLGNYGLIDKVVEALPF